MSAVSSSAGLTRQQSVRLGKQVSFRIVYEKAPETEAQAGETAEQRKATIAEWEAAAALHPKIAAIAKKYDLNGDGKFSLSEVQKMAEELQCAKQDASRLTIFAGGVLFAMILLSVSVFGLSFAAVESAKESHVMGRAEVDLQGNKVSTQSAEIIAKVCATSDCVSSAAATDTARRLQSSGATVAGTLPKSTFLEMKRLAEGTNRHGSISLNALGGGSKIVQMGDYEILSIADAADGSHKMDFYCDVCESKQKYTAICNKEDTETCTVYYGLTARRLEAASRTEDEFKMLEDDFKRRNRGDGRAPDKNMRLLGKCSI